MRQITSLRAIPGGSRVFLPGEARRKREVEESLLGVFEQWGFRELLTPAFEFYVPRAGSEVLDAQTYRMVDLESGGLLALRADMTPQIARAAGTILAAHPRPLRLSYATNVFRHAHVAGELQREFWQAGVELIGLVSLEADAEMIAIAVECLQANGVEHFRMSLSHGAFLRGILGGLSLDGAQRAELLEAIERRDSSGVTSLLKGVPRQKTDAGLLERVPECFGGVEVLRGVEEKIRTPAARGAVRELLRVFRILELYGLSERVIFDLCDFKDFDYYTGVIFEGFVEGSGYPVCGGGRYDKLLGQYGDDALGTGFAVDLNQMLPLVTQGAESRNGTDFLVIDLTREKRSGIVLSRKLRARGWRVARDIIRRDLAGSLEYARATGVSKCLVIERGGKRGGRARLLEPDGEDLGAYPVEEILARVGGRDDNR